MSFYTELAGTVREVLREFGAAGTLSRETPGGYDPETGSTEDSVSSSADVVAAMFDFEDKMAGTQFAPGSLIEEGDKRVYADVPTGFTPTPGDALTWGDGTYYVKAVKEIAPARVAVMYELQVCQ